MYFSIKKKRNKIENKPMEQTQTVLFELGAPF